MIANDTLMRKYFWITIIWMNGECVFHVLSQDINIFSC